MGLFDRKIRPLTSTSTKAEFLERRRIIRKAGAHQNGAMPIYGSKEIAFDPDYSTDVLAQRADFAQFINSVSHGGRRMAVEQSYRDCDGYSGTHWHVIPACLSSYRLLEQQCEEASDGTFSLYIRNDRVVFAYAPQHVRDRIAQ